jgi:Type II secretion system (T2SS), protein L
MTTLRIRLAVPFDPSAPAAWWRVDDQRRIVERGTSAPSAWPAADRIEAALGAGDVRIVALELPPMNDTRRAAAAAFALEDQLAAPADTLHLAVTAAASVGTPTVVRIVDRAAVAWLAARRPAIDRVVAEPDLAPADGAWHWCVDADGRGFVRRRDTSAFAADAPEGSELPAELAAALAHARGDAGAVGALPARIVVDAPADAPRLAAWTQATGVTFV